jgi:GxxExxY protein
MESDELSRSVIGWAIDVHRTLGPGLLESTYRQRLAYELSHAQISFQMEMALPVRYKDVLLDCGDRIDLLVGGALIVEVKSVETLLPIPPGANPHLPAASENSNRLTHQFQRDETPGRD